MLNFKNLLPAINQKQNPIYPGEIFQSNRLRFRKIYFTAKFLPKWPMSFLSQNFILPNSICTCSILKANLPYYTLDQITNKIDFDV